MKGAEEDIAGNYFKPVRVNRLIAQAQETQRAASKLSSVEQWVAFHTGGIREEYIFVSSLKIY